MSRIFVIVALMSAALGCMADPVTKTRLGSLNPREGLVVTDIDLSAIGGGGVPGDYSTVSNRAMNAAPAKNQEFTSFVKDDGTVYHYIMTGIWSTVKGDDYLNGARLYLWIDTIGGGYPASTNWTWYITGGVSSQYRTIYGVPADSEVLRFKYNSSTTNWFMRGHSVMYADTVGEMVSTSVKKSEARINRSVTNIVRDVSLGGIWDRQLEVWWTPIMENGALRYVAATNVNLSAEGNE